MKIIPYGKQCIDSSDIAEVVKVLKSNWLTQGPMVEKFERALANYCDVKYAVAVSSGTAALHLACLVVGLKKGDEAITTPITFLATPNSIVYTGAKPVFADIDYETINIDPEKIKAAISKKTKAILPVHFAGLPCDMARIHNIVKGKGIKVIEDACHALGSRYLHMGRWIKVGSCVHSDMTVFSFHPVKAITTGEGGAITTNNKALYLKLLALRSHGIYKTPGMSESHGKWHYEMRELGFNYRITDFACALGISQVKKLDTFIERRREIALIYDKRITKAKKQICDYGKRHACHLYVLRIDFSNVGISRINLVNNLKNRGISTQVHYIPVYRQPYYRRRYRINPAKYPNAEKYYCSAISIPLFPAMKKGDGVYIANVLEKMLSEKNKRGRHE